MSLTSANLVVKYMLKAIIVVELHYTDYGVLMVAARHSCNVVEPIRKVTQLPDQLILGWVTSLQTNLVFTTSYPRQLSLLPYDTQTTV